MSTVYSLPDGTQVYDYNGQTINAKTGVPISGTASAPTPTPTPVYGAVNTQPVASAPAPTATGGSLPTSALQPGSTGPAVQALQQWLVANGFMSQADMNTGPGVYGPKTTAAVAALQNKLGVNNSSGPGYFGPQTIAAVQNAISTTPAASGGTTGTTGGASGITVGSTGDPGLDNILNSIKGVADGLVKNGYTIPSTLQITPALVSQFLEYAHQAVDPYTQQQISARLADVNANLQNIATQYGNNMAQVMQDFGTNLATEQNNAANAGTAFSGLRGLTENNLAASTNRNLSSLASDAAYNIGNAARSAAADVGSTNAGGIVLPTLSTGTVSLAGGSRGTTGTGANLSYNYNPSIYTVGAIPSAGIQNVNQQEQSYLSQYGTLASAQSNSGRSVSDLLGLMSGLPAGYKVPSSLT